MIDPVTGMIIAGGLGAVGAGITASGQTELQREAIEAPYKARPERKKYAETMAGMYPELKGLELPGIAPEAMNLVSMLMKGGLPPEMTKALGLGAEQEYGTALAGMPGGVGPIALGKMRAGVMGRLGQTKAMMGFQGMQTGLQAVPQISELMMQPQKWGAEEQRRRWVDIVNMFQNIPGAAYGTPTF